MPLSQFSPAQALLLAIDLQEKLLPHIDGHERVLARSVALIRSMRMLGLPIVWTEQYPKGLGPTVTPVAAAIAGNPEAEGSSSPEDAEAAAKPMEKTSFGCFGDRAIAAALQSAKDAGWNQLLLCGIEAHVCVLQTALVGLERGWQVFVAHDACGSRRAEDRALAEARLIRAGAIPVSAEMVIMEALRGADAEHFKAILPLLKER